MSTVAVAACGGVVEDQGLHGSIANCAPDDLSCAGGGLRDAGGGLRDAANPCAQGCGLVPSTYDAGDADADVEDAGPVGLVVQLDGGDEDDASIIVGVIPHR